MPKPKPFAALLALALASTMWVSLVEAQSNSISTERRIDKRKGLSSPPTKDDTIRHRVTDVVGRADGPLIGTRVCPAPFASGSQFTLIIARRDLLNSVVTLRGNCFGTTQGTISLTSRTDDLAITAAANDVAATPWASNQATFLADGIPRAYLFSAPQETLTFELNVGATRVQHIIAPLDVTRLRNGETLTQTVRVP